MTENLPAEILEPGQLTLFELAEVANTEHRLCVQSAEGMAEHAIKAGEALNQAKAQVRRGEWLSWLRDNFVASEDTAEIYMKVARNSERARNVESSSIRGALKAIGGDPSVAHLSSAKDEWATPQDLYDACHAEFGFTLDVCASPENAKCEQFYSENGLEQEWAGVCWMNPPYSEVAAWMAKARESANNGATVVCLVPSRTDVGWFWDTARHGQVRFLRGRLHFVDDEGNTGPAPFPSCIVVFGRETGMYCWDWEA